MTDPILANAAITAASSLLIQNSARQLSKTQQVPSAPLTTAQSYALIGTFGFYALALLLLTVVLIRTIFDRFFIK